MSKPTSALQIVTAYDLRRGFSLFMASDGGWHSSIREAGVASKGEEAESLLTRAQEDEANNKVVDAYLIDIDMIEGKPQPVRLRERLRLGGPSILVDGRPPYRLSVCGNGGLHAQSGRSALGV